MIRKLLFLVFTFFAGIIGQAQITLTTTSTSAAWSPETVINSTAPLKWSVSGGVTIPEVVTNDPTFDLSGNTGTATITITSDDGFAGLSLLYMLSDYPTGALITNIDLSNATALTTLDMRYNQLTTLDLSANTALTSLTVRGNEQFFDQAFDTSSNTQLTIFRADDTGINSVDLSNNPLLTDVRLYRSRLTSAVMDQMLIDLDNHGLSNGILQISDQQTGQSITFNSLIAYNNLISKGWTIDVPAPAAPITQQITLTTTSTSAAWSPETVINSTAPLKWSVSGGVTIPEVVTNDPTFDLSGNTGNATITITSDDGFAGLSLLYMLSDYPTGALITNINLSNASALTNLDMRYNQLTSLDLSQNTALTSLIIRGNDQFPDQAFNTSANTQLTIFRADDTGINSVDLSNNSLLTDVRLYGSRLTSSVMDQILIDLDNHGLSNGILQIAGQQTGQSITFNSLNAYNNLISKGWTIDVPAPAAPITQQITLTTTSTSAAWSPETVINSTAPLKWSVSGGVTIPEIITNDPTFDLSGNTGIATVTITSDDGFAGLSLLYMLSDYPTGALITNINLSNATALTTLDLRYNQLSNLDLSQNTALSSLTVRGNNQFFDQSFNTSSNTQLTIFRADDTGINSVDLSNNPLLIDVRLYGSRLTSSVMNQILIDLDNHGLSNGILQIAGQQTGQSITFNSLIAYNNLVAKGWTIDVPAPAAAPGPEINLVGNGLSIPSGNTPIVADDTDFGQVAIGSPVTKTFTIQNLGDQNLIVTAFPSGTDFTFVPPFLNNITILPGQTQVISATFTPQVVGVKTGTITIFSNDPNESSYIVNLRAEGVTTLANPTIVVSGNSIPIVNGDNTPDVADDTDFGQIINNGTQINTFTIANNGTGNLSISNINVVNFQNTEFSVEPLTFPIVIAEGGSFDFDVTFSPLSSGIYSAVVQISHSDIDEISPYSFRVTGEGIVAPAEVMITQYYEGVNNDKWIEVRNISGNSIPANTYYLALYDQNSARVGIIDINSPTQSEPIPALGVNQAVLFRNGAAALPGAGNIGGAIQIVTNVCTFSQGDDVILISTSNGADCYNNRVDIIGNVSAGPGLSPDPMTSPATFIKGGCSSESAHLVYNETDWTLINVLDVNNANPNTNLALGTQTVGSTTFNGSVWSNLAPDQSRIAIISASFSGAGSSIFACDLIINPGVNVVFDSNSTSTNSIVVYDDLTINGSLTIGDQESLVTYKDNAALGVITKIEESEPLTNIHDVTYWSSPVQGSQTNVIFNGVNPTRIFRYGPELGENPIYAGTEYRYWYQYSGGMERGRGYAAEGSSTGVQTLTFTGVPYNGNFTRQVWYSGDEDDQPGENDNFNLVGNPYPAAINIDLFLSNNTYVNEIALWSHATPISGGDSGSFTDADYILYSLAGAVPQGAATNNIGSSQGFMARTTNPGGAAGLYNVIYNNGFKLVGLNDQFFKLENSKKSIESKDERDRIWLRLGDGRSKDEILVGFFNETTDGIDSRYDAAGGLGNKNIRFYSQMENYRLAIQALGVFSPEKSVPLGFKIKEAKDLTISMSGKEGIFRGMDIYLVDHALNKTHNLKEGDYKFNQTTTGDFPNRFTLQFSKNAVDVDKIIEGSEFNVFNSAEGFRINASKVVKEVKVYDMLGRTIMSSKPNQQSFNLHAGNLKTGAVLIFEVKLENGTILNKKAIRM